MATKVPQGTQILMRTSTLELKEKYSDTRELVGDSVAEATDWMIRAYIDHANQRAADKLKQRIAADQAALDKLGFNEASVLAGTPAAENLVEVAA